MKVLVMAAALLAGAGAAKGADEFRIGPDGVRVPVTTEVYDDGHHHRHEFQVPSDWRNYHHPLGWYRAHPQWWLARDWYRRAGGGIDGASAQSDTKPSHS